MIIGKHLNGLDDKPRRNKRKSTGLISKIC